VRRRLLSKTEQKTARRVPRGHWRCRYPRRCRVIVRSSLDCRGHCALTQSCEEFVYRGKSGRRRSAFERVTALDEH